MDMLWPFDQPRNESTVTVKQITAREKPIRLVIHYSGGEGWAFLSGEEFAMKDATLVALHELTDLDPSILMIADLPPGWAAERTAVGGHWKKYQNPDDE